MGLGKRNKAITTKCLVIGEDRKLAHRGMEATGVFFLDHKNLLAYDSLPEAIGACTQVQGDSKRHLGQTSLLYEPMARPFSFANLNWAQIDHKEEVILAGARSEGSSKAVQSMESEDRFSKLTTMGLILVLGVLGMALLFALQSGILHEILGR